MPSPLYIAQPRAVYLKRTPLVVDSSLLAAWIFGEARALEAEAQLLGHLLYAPALSQYEIANVGMNKVRSGVLNADDVLIALTHFAELDMTFCPIESKDMFSVAAKLKLTAYDAAYVCLAEQLNAPLVTFDEALGKAAIAHFSVAKP
jgi:predicted nucleic acid-binding protein